MARHLVIAKGVKTGLSKKYDNLFNEIVSYENLYNAYRKVRRGKNKYNIDAMAIATTLFVVWLINMTISFMNITK